MMQLHFDPFPYLHTERLKLRPLSEADAPEIFELRSNPETMKFIPRPIALTLDDAIQNIRLVLEMVQKNEGINWAITHQNSDKLIGTIGLYRLKPEDFRTEIGYMLHPDQQNKGYITEAIRSVLHYTFEVCQFHSVEAIIDPDNTASERVLVKNGFVKEGHLKENGYWNGQFLDTVIYSLLRRNFKVPNSLKDRI